MKLLEPFFRRFDIDATDLTGTTLAGEIPVSENLINRLIARKLERHAQLASIRVAAQNGDQMIVRVEPRARLIPTLSVLLRIEKQPDLPRDPTLRLRWSMPAAGPLAMLAGTVLGYLKAMPAGIRVDGDTAIVDLNVLLRSRGLEEVQTLVRRVAFHTRPGAVIVQIEAGLS
jgi:hypothetical protein